MYLLVFLLPLFWLPFSFEAYEFNKQYLLFFLVSVAFLVWLAKMVLVDKEIRFRQTPLDIPVFLFLLVAILSAIFSVDKNSSLLGFYGRFSNGLIGLLGWGVFYFLITNNFKNQEEISSLLKIFLGSVFFTILISYLSVFGVWAKIPGVPFWLTQRTFNPVFGSLEGLAVFLSVIVVLLTGLLLFLKWHFKQLGYWVLLITSLGLLIIIDFSPAWITLIVSLGLFLIFALVKRIFKENVNRLLLPIFLIILVLAFLFIDGSKFQQSIFQFPKEQILGQGISWKVAFSAIKENVKSGFLGTGIGTWQYDFSKQKPTEFNKNFWWQIRFDRAGNHIAEILGTMGIFGIISYFFLISIFFLVSWFLIKNREFLPQAMAVLAILVGQFVYYQNTSLAFLFWLFLGISVISWQRPLSEKIYSFKDFPELSLVFTSLLILLALATLGSYFLFGRLYLADMNYNRGFWTASTEEKTKLFEKAVNLNKNLVFYQMSLAQAYLLQILEEAAKPINQQDSTKLQNLVAMAVDTARRATEISPNNVASWENLAVIYREIQLLATGATVWAIKSFEEAIKLEPKNPVLFTELGKLYLNLDIQKAKENFAKAKELKSDYPEVWIQEALIYEREGNFDEVIKRMEEVVKNFPLNIDAKFQLGRLYFNKGRTEEAISQFEQVILLLPNHSNALYSLGVAYSRKGEKERAIWAFEKVLQLNPGNQDVIQKLEELKK